MDAANSDSMAVPFALNATIQCLGAIGTMSALRKPMETRSIELTADEVTVLLNLLKRDFKLKEKWLNKSLAHKQSPEVLDKISSARERTLSLYQKLYEQPI